MSSKNTPSPCRRRLSSLRGTFSPAHPGCGLPGSATTGWGGATVVSVTGGRALDRFDDVHIAGAAAQIALDRLADLLLARVRIRTQQRRRAHQHPRCAIAALQRVV